MDSRKRKYIESGRFKYDDVILAFNALRELGLIKPLLNSKVRLGS